MRRFRIFVVLLTLGLAVLGSAAAWPWHPAAGKGVLAGGCASALAFWLMARSVEKLASLGDGALQLSAFKWTAFRMLIYGFTLYRGFAWAPEEPFPGVLGVVAGLLLLHVALVFVAVTNLDKRGQPPD